MKRSKFDDLFFSSEHEIEANTQFEKWNEEKSKKLRLKGKSNKFKQGIEHKK